ncbi:uncharacterized protein LOC143291034 [Babylonia areolata]|uniref:uncharacterized protein LOC143291034 n=1 Tax=Babylonia areolata TaxID=304850 RepID=UPI003FD66FC4
MGKVKDLYQCLGRKDLSSVLKRCLCKEKLPDPQFLEILRNTAQVSKWAYLRSAVSRQFRNVRDRLQSNANGAGAGGGGGGGSSSSSSSSSSPGEDSMALLVSWWEKTVMKSGKDPAMSADVYDRLVARFSGPATTILIPTATRPPKEIKTEWQAVAELGLRFSRLALYPDQVDMLNSSLPPCVYLRGPPGCGKTVVLVLKALQLLNQGKHVHLICVSQEGRAVTALIRHQLNACLPSTNLLHLHSFDIKKTEDVEAAVKEIVGWSATPMTMTTTTTTYATTTAMVTSVTTAAATTMAATMAASTAATAAAATTTSAVTISAEATTTSKTAAAATTAPTTTATAAAATAPTTTATAAAATARTTTATAAAAATAPTTTATAAAPTAPTTTVSATTATATTAAATTTAAMTASTTTATIAASATTASTATTAASATTATGGPGCGDLSVIIDELVIVNKNHRELLRQLLVAAEGGPPLNQAPMTSINIWAAGLYSMPTFPPWLNVQSLTDPLRCPPAVHRHVSQNTLLGSVILQYGRPEVPPHVGQGGPTVQWLHHAGRPGHSKSKSPEECEKCGEQIAFLLNEELHIGEPDQLQYRDVFIFTDSLPSDNAPFIRGLRNRQVPVKVFTGADPPSTFEEVALAVRDEVVVTDFEVVSGLERRVVIGMKENSRNRLWGMSRCTAQLYWFDEEMM